MKRFFVRYLLFTAILFALFYLPSNPISVALNTLQTKMTLKILSILLWHNAIQGIDIRIDPHYTIYISQACNGFIPILILYASLLAYPASWLYRIVWMLAGYLIFNLVNIGRIVFVAHMTRKYGHEAFHWSHDLLGNAILILTGLLLFIAFIKGARKQNGL